MPENECYGNLTRAEQLRIVQRELDAERATREGPGPHMPGPSLASRIVDALRKAESDA